MTTAQDIYLDRLIELMSKDGLRFIEAKAVLGNPQLTQQLGPYTAMHSGISFQPFGHNINWRLIEGDSTTPKCSYCCTTSDEKHQCPNCGAPKTL